jgi:reactive chlorine resistance protein C
MTIANTARIASTKRITEPATTLTLVGAGVLRYGLALVLLWIGFLKFQPYEATAIMPLIAHSPFMAWLLPVFGLDLTAHIIGSFEIVAALLIALRTVSPQFSMIGGILGVFTFLATLSFIFTTPAMAVYAPDHSFPFFAMVGQFLIKDVVLLGAALYVAGESWLALSQPTRLEV